MISKTKEILEKVKGSGKGLIPQPDILLLLIATPLLLTLVFVMAPLLQRTMAGAISMQVNMKRMYYPLNSENTLTTLLNSEFQGERMSKMLTYYIYYDGEFEVNGKYVNNTAKQYLRKLSPTPDYFLLLNGTDFEENISNSAMEDLERADAYVSKVNLRTPDMEEVRIELRFPKG